MSQLWLADIRTWPENCPDDWVQRLSQGEYQRFQRMNAHSPVAREYLCARMLARHALTQNYSHPRAWVLAPHGPSQVLSPTASELGGSVHINLSHSRGVVLCLLSTRGPCGCDVENTPRPGHSEKIAQRHFTAREIAWLQALDGDEWNEAFFTMWTQKEAYLKTRKVGIAGGLQRLEVLPQGREWKVGTREHEDHQTLSFWRLRWQHAHVAIVLADDFNAPTKPELYVVRSHDGLLRHRSLDATGLHRVSFKPALVEDSSA